MADLSISLEVARNKGRYQWHDLFEEYKNETIREQIERKIQRTYKERMWWAKLKWKMVKKRKKQKVQEGPFLRTRPTQRLEVKSRAKIAKPEQEQLPIVERKHRLMPIKQKPNGRECLQLNEGSPSYSY